MSMFEQTHKSNQMYALAYLQRNNNNRGDIDIKQFIQNVQMPNVANLKQAFASSVNDSVTIDRQQALQLLRLANYIYDNRALLRISGYDVNNNIVGVQQRDNDKVDRVIDKKPLRVIQNMVNKIDDNNAYKLKLQNVINELHINYQDTTLQTFLDLYKEYVRDAESARNAVRNTEKIFQDIVNLDNNTSNNPDIDVTPSIRTKDAISYNKPIDDTISTINTPLPPTSTTLSTPLSPSPPPPPPLPSSSPASPYLLAPPPPPLPPSLSEIQSSQPPIPPPMPIESNKSSTPGDAIGQLMNEIRQGKQLKRTNNEISNTEQTVVNNNTGDNVSQLMDEIKKGIKLKKSVKRKNDVDKAVPTAAINDQLLTQIRQGVALKKTDNLNKMTVTPTRKLVNPLMNILNTSLKNRRLAMTSAEDTASEHTDTWMSDDNDGSVANLNTLSVRDLSRYLQAKLYLLSNENVIDNDNDLEDLKQVRDLIASGSLDSLKTAEIRLNNYQNLLKSKLSHSYINPLIHKGTLDKPLYIVNEHEFKTALEDLINNRNYTGALNELKKAESANVKADYFAKMKENLKIIIAKNESEA
ncbi:hypothetical protein [Orgyia leucostigma nucleopolyhedrovirus]|uniref:WH2 domain-containing protein n=1 Tax=Orgyia leucostigma nucleopolyhedrovirus TaxID=490711 RepID=B0FDM0_9ABAC|nr:hypothetical protein [Orgyia leucostigma nucleopolyhedrovirus]ABY65728.1 hypothetical protein [Orgyia leucostigma nucleopolyhedrovirus]